MVNHSVFLAVFKSAKNYPKLEWVVADGYDHARIWQDGKDTRWHHGGVFPPNVFKRATTVKCIYYDDNDEVSIRIDVSDLVGKEMTEDMARKFLIEDMVRRLSYAVFCPEARNDTD